MKVVIFGTEKLATLTWYALSNDSPHEVAGFTVDAAYRAEDHKHGLPVVAFEHLEQSFPPAETALIAPIGLNVMSGLLAARLQAARKRGYTAISYVSSRAITSPDLVIGQSCLIFAGTTVEPFVDLGDGTIVRGGCFLSHDVSIAGSCFLGPRVTLAGGVMIEERCFIGVGAVVLPKVRIARGCFIAAGAHVSRDTEEGGVYAGSPAVRRKLPASRVSGV
jgi:sugar O-acyltransferase (sialic acid O-acetyltransferase NeuD family)